MMRWPACEPARAHPPAAASPTPRPTLFLDRDGVLVIDRDYLDDPDAVTLIPGVPQALARARAAGFQLVGVSNQSGLGRGRFTAAQLDAVMERLTGLLQGSGAPLDAFFYCPHAPAVGCRCRKPAPGLLHEAATELPWDADRSWVIGDKISDVDLALGAGLRPVLVRTGHGAEQARDLGDRAGVPVVADLPAAVDLVLREAAR
jgi:D-glycero-D-manno-heptose 1,7-bisphosphate phosphatase